MRLEEYLLKEGVNPTEMRKSFTAGFKDLAKIELEYLAKLECIMNRFYRSNEELNRRNEKLKSENEQLKEELRRLKEDKEENEATFTKLLKQQEEIYKNIKAALGGKIND